MRNVYVNLKRAKAIVLEQLFQYSNYEGTVECFDMYNYML
jgi:hypothetical protein